MKIVEWWNGTGTGLGLTNSGIPTPKEKTMLLLNIPEYWNRLDAFVRQKPFTWRDGIVTEHPTSNLESTIRTKRILECENFASKWRLKAQFIQPMTFAIVTSATWEICKWLFQMF